MVERHALAESFHSKGRPFGYVLTPACNALGIANGGQVGEGVILKNNPFVIFNGNLLLFTLSEGVPFDYAPYRGHNLNARPLDYIEHNLNARPLNYRGCNLNASPLDYRGHNLNARPLDLLKHNLNAHPLKFENIVLMHVLLAF